MPRIAANELRRLWAQTQQQAVALPPQASPARTAERKRVQTSVAHLSPALAHMVAVHGTPQNVLGARTRALGSLVARGEMGIHDATATLYQVWQRLSSDEARSQADPDKVWGNIERRLNEAVVAFEKRLDRQDAKRPTSAAGTPIEQAEASRWEAKRQRGEAIAPKTPTEASQGQQLRP